MWVPLRSSCLHIKLIYFFLVDAVINTPSGLTVSWNGSPLGNLKLDSVNVVGDVGASLDVNAAFTVADVGHLTDFTKVRSGSGCDVTQASLLLCLGSAQ